MEFISQIQPRRFHSANQCWTMEGGNEDNYLYGVTHDEGFGAGVTSVFVPTGEQRAQIAAGTNIALTVLGGQPPVMLRLTDEPIGRKP